MCGHCGCHGADAIRELEDEHEALVDRAHADVPSFLTRSAT